MLKSSTPEEAARMLDNLLGNLPGMAYRCNFDQDYTMIYISQACQELTGYEAEELLDNSVLSYNDLIHPEDRSKVWLKVLQGVEKRRRFEINYRIKTRDGELKWVWEKGNAIYDEKTGQPMFLEGFIIDVSKEKSAEQEIFDRESRLAEILKVVDLGVVVAEETGIVIEVNPAFSEITGIPGEDLIGHSAYALAQKLLPATTNDEVTPGLMEAFHGKTPPPGEIKYNNRLLRMETHTTPTGKVVTFLTDVTRQKEYEDNLLNAKLRAEESDRLKSSFLANMSHEIRTPMNGIVGFSELLRDTDLTHEEKERYIEIIHVNSEQLLHIINDILDLSRIEAGRLGVFPHKFDPYPLFKNLVQTAQILVKQKPIQIKLKYDLPNGFILESDKNRVNQILFNLISNAVKFTEKGVIELGAFRNSWDYIEFYVRDTGIGVPKKTGQKIFERFRQGHDGDNRPYAGTGLGLSISKALVNMMGGQIGYSSTEGKGSYFYFTLPNELVVE